MGILGVPALNPFGTLLAAMLLKHPADSPLEQT